MEMSLMQQSALSLQSLQASTSPWHVVAGSSIQRFGGLGNSGLAFCNVGPGGNSVSVWNLRQVTLNHERRGTSCRSSGGTRRDDAKIVARTQKRRSRHVKGVTPTKPELFDELQAEKEADSDLERYQASVDSNVDTDANDEAEDISADGNDEDGVELLEKPGLKVEAANGKPNGDSDYNTDVNVEQERWDQGSSSGSGGSGVEEIVERSDTTYTVKYFPEGKGGSKPSGRAAQNTIQDTAEVAEENLSEVGDTVQEKVQDVVEEVGEAAGEISDIAGDTAKDVTGTAQETVSDVSNAVQDTALDLTSTAQETAGINVEGEGSSSSPGVEEIVESGDNTYTIKYFPEGKGRPIDARQATRDTAGVGGESLREVGDTVQDNVEDVVQQTGEAAGEISDIAQDTAEDVTSEVQEVAEETGKNLSEVGDAVRGNVEEGTEELGSAAAGIADIAQDTAQDVAKTAQETAQEVGKNLGEAGNAVLGSLDDVGTEGQKQLQAGQKEAEENLSELGSQAEEAGDRAGKALGKVSDEAGKSLQNVQESLSALVEDSARAAGTLRNEALRLGEVVLTAAGEAAGFQGNPEESGISNGSSPRQAVKEKPKTEEKKSTRESKQSGTTGNQDIQGTGYKPSQPEERKEEETNLYRGLKVTVAGASGRTGRLLVEELVRKGVPVRALVRDKNKFEARELGKLSNVEVVQADLYKYETIKKSLGDSNVVISAVGARSFPFDPIGTYQAEFEGVKNLVAAAKNKGDVKKFVFVTSLGVTFLQIIPLIFWKKQSELYLQRSGLDYTIVRPGGLTSGTNVREVILMKPADTQFGGSISRKKVAEVCVAALVTPEASEKIVEIVSGGGASRSFSDLFGSV